MQIHCLGTTGYHPNDTRHTSCYFLADSGIVLDAGTGMYRMASLLQTDSVDILLSHAHLDHIAGLTFLLDVFFQRPVQTLRIWGQSEKLRSIRTHLFDEAIFPVQLRAEWCEIDDLPSFDIESRDGNPVRVDWRLQDHPGGSVAYRLRWPEENKTLVYATDTTGDLSAENLQWMQGADLLMHECYFKDSEKEWAIKTGHCWTSRAADVAKQARVKRLLLTHINPLTQGDDAVEIDKARAIFPETMVAHDHDIVSF